MSDKLYQRKEPVISSVHTKVKGIAEVTENVTEGGVTVISTVLLSSHGCRVKQDLQAAAALWVSSTFYDLGKPGVGGEGGLTA